MSRDQMIPSALSHGTPGSLPPLSAMRRFGPVWIVRFPAVIRFARRAGLAGLLLWAGSGWSRADDRILLPVVINGQPRTFVFDTGCGRALVMYRSTAEKLGLQIASPSADIQPRPGKVLLGQTEPCTVTLLGRTGSSPFGILETPSDIIPDKAGLVGWPLVSQEIIRFRAVGQQEQVTLEPMLPADLDGWLKVRVIPGQILKLAIPAADGPPLRVNIDSGTSDGVTLQSEEFHAWRARNPDSKSTLEAFWEPAYGLIVRQEIWAEQLSLGLLPLREVPVLEATDSDFEGRSHDLVAVLGMAALRRLDLVVDGPNLVAYLRPSQTSTARYDQNRMGAVFVPRDVAGPDLIAVVAARSPAERAGVQNGDVLLKIDSLDVTAWRTRPGILPLARFWTRPAGTRLVLTVQRGNQTLVLPVVLEEILGP